MTSEEEGLPINATVLALILIFVPGIICYGIVAYLAPKKERSNATVALQMFIYGIASYLILFLFQHAFPAWATTLHIHAESVKLLDPSKIAEAPIHPATIAWATVIGVILGIIVTLNLEYRILTFAGKKLKISRRFADHDVWDFILNSSDTNNWVTIRDEEQKKAYQGYVGAFSTGGEPRALVLQEVIVYDLDGQVLSDTLPILYMSFDEGPLSIEFGRKESKTSHEEQKL